MSLPPRKLKYMNTTKSILIRADGNSEIATGHLRRCLSIADALAELHVEAHFLVSDEISAGLLSSFFTPGNAYPIHLLHSDYRRPEAELSALLPFLSAYPSWEKEAGRMPPSSDSAGRPILLVDSYFVTPAYLKALRQAACLVYMDDLLAFDYPVDLVVNYDFEPPAAFYTQAKEALLGCRYTPLRKQFCDLSPIVRRSAHSLFLSTGGTDEQNITGNLLSALLADPFFASWEFYTLTGPLHVHRRTLLQMAQKHPQIRLCENVENMASLMSRCDLAASAAGTTLYELCAAGVPAISFTLADNQQNVARDMQQYAQLPYAGDVKAGKVLISNLHALLKSLASDYEARLRLSASMHAQIDGRGAWRIANALCAL